MQRNKRLKQNQPIRKPIKKWQYPPPPPPPKKKKKKNFCKYRPTISGSR